MKNYVLIALLSAITLTNKAEESVFDKKITEFQEWLRGPMLYDDTDILKMDPTSDKEKIETKKEVKAEEVKVTTEPSTPETPEQKPAPITLPTTFAEIFSSIEPNEFDQPENFKSLYFNKQKDKVSAVRDIALKTLADESQTTPLTYEQIKTAIIALQNYYRYAKELLKGLIEDSHYHKVDIYLDKIKALIASDKEVSLKNFNKQQLQRLFYIEFDKFIASDLSDRFDIMWQKYQKTHDDEEIEESVEDDDDDDEWQ